MQTVSLHHLCLINCVSRLCHSFRLNVSVQWLVLSDDSRRLVTSPPLSSTHGAQSLLALRKRRCLWFVLSWVLDAVDAVGVRHGSFMSVALCDLLLRARARRTKSFPVYPLVSQRLMKGQFHVDVVQHPPPPTLSNQSLSIRTPLSRSITLVSVHTVLQALAVERLCCARI